MPDNIFKLVALDILRLHRHCTQLLLALTEAGQPSVSRCIYAISGNCYYALLPEKAPETPSEQGIMLIRSHDLATQISWVADAQIIQPKDRRYKNAIAAIKRRLPEYEAVSSPCLLELTPRHGRLITAEENNFAITAEDLKRALYPAAA